MKSISFHPSADELVKLFLAPLYKGDYDTLSNTSEKMLGISQETFQKERDKIIKIGLYECTVLGCFDEMKSRLKLSEWAEKSKIESIQNIAQQICGEEKPSEAHIHSIDAAGYHWTIAKECFDNGMYKEAFHNALLARNANPSEREHQKKTFELFLKLGHEQLNDDKAKEAINFFRMAHEFNNNSFDDYIPFLLKYYVTHNDNEMVYFLKSIVTLPIFREKAFLENQIIHSITDNEWIKIKNLLLDTNRIKSELEKNIDKKLTTRQPPLSDRKLAVMCYLYSASNSLEK